MAKKNKVAPKTAAPKTQLAKPKSTKPTASKSPPKAAAVKSRTVAKPVAPAKTAAKPVAKAPAVVAKAVAKPEVKVAPKMPAKAVEPSKPAPAKAASAAVVARPVTAVPAQRAMPAAAGAKATEAKLTAPAQPARPAAAKVEAKPAADTGPKKPVTTRHGFKTNELIVYPAHGVGRIIGIEEQEIAGISLELFVIEFEKDKMTLRVPTSKLASVGMRKLAEDDVMKKAMDTLKGKARIKRTMWSRRAQEYEAKINSGDLVAIAEVVRDLYRSEAQPEQSYSERQLYEAALDRMSRELAAVDRSDERGAMQRITEVLAKSARGRRAAEEGTSVAADDEAEIKAA